MIKFKHVSLRYQDSFSLKDVSFNVQKGDFYFIIGKSGAGKSSLLKLLSSEIPPTEGEFTVLNEQFKPRSKVNHDQLANYRQDIGIIYQDFRLLADLTVFDNLAYPLIGRGLDKEEITTKIKKVMRDLGIAELSQHFPREISGGEQQRVAIGRGVITEPALLIADEPTANIDEKNSLRIMSLLENLNQQGTTIIMASHDVKLVNNYQHPVIELAAGQVLRIADQGGYYDSEKEN
ncbi:cell division ATP-binding protein FtsE [Vagococcus salmoninarum]|uniref:cell division ATP-binding protein FtsE n=1 Tax=Vagococcus salmoninarum TaxID=2739 RepID=UPI00187E1163|nr:ATP-binding cassette domain-containing protein [Vagococcus salmoninarum]MBE9388143.1 ATP-binding cassette domain-containing protein [Vagococcus salmoninarum]